MTESSLRTDIIGVWTSTKETIDGGRVQGREKREWQTVLSVYFGLIVFELFVAKLTGADRLLDYFSNDEPSLSDWYSTLFLTAGMVLVIAVLSFLQWFILPRVSGWFGGSRNNADATLAYYYLFCAGIIVCLMTIVIDVLSVGIQAIATPYGSYLSAMWIAIVVIAGLHISARIIETAQFVKSYAHGIGVSLISFLLACIPFILLLFAALSLISAFFPNFWDGTP